MDDYDKFCQTTFNDWFDESFPEGLKYLDVMDTVTDPYDDLPDMFLIKELMRRAWLSRYETLTYHDL